MERIDLEPILRTHPFLEGFERRHTLLLAGMAEERLFADGDFLGRLGQPADRFYLIRDGRVSLEVHLPTSPGVRIQTLRGGDVLGRSWIIQPHTWRLDARALAPVRAVALDAGLLRRACDEDHDLGYLLLLRLLRVVARRLLATRLRLARLTARLSPGEPRADD